MNSKSAKITESIGHSESQSIPSEIKTPLVPSSSDANLNSLNPKDFKIVLKTPDIDSKPSIVKNEKQQEEIKDEKKPGKTLRLEAVRAAIKIAIKCKIDSGYELMQGFATNMQSLALDMGRLNAISHILPKIPLLLVCLF